MNTKCSDDCLLKQCLIRLPTGKVQEVFLKHVEAGANQPNL